MRLDIQTLYVGALRRMVREGSVVVPQESSKEDCSKIVDLLLQRVPLHLPVILRWVDDRRNVVVGHVIANSTKDDYELTGMKFFPGLNGSTLLDLSLPLIRRFSDDSKVVVWYFYGSDDELEILFDRLT